MDNSQENLRGSALMVAAMALFALEDMFLKCAAQSLPVGEVLMLFGFGGLIGFALLARFKGQRLVHPAMVSRPLIIKAAMEVIGRLGYTLGIALTPLSNASAILQATPLVVVAGAAVIFGERVGIRRWLAIGIGFIGVLVILQPGADGFVPAALWTVLGVFGFAGRDLATRAAPRILSNFQLGLHGFAALIPTGALILAFTGGAVAPSLSALALVAVATCFGVCAYWWLTSAMRMGEVSVVTPFRYTRLLFGVALGVIVFSEELGPATLVGAVLILSSGLYTLIRGRRVSRPVGG